MGVRARPYSHPRLQPRRQIRLIPKPLWKDGHVCTFLISSFVSLPKVLRLKSWFSSSSIQATLPAALKPILQHSMTTFSRVGLLTKIVQTFAILEVVHVILGWVRSPLATTAMQVSSRLFLVWGIADQFPEVCINVLFSLVLSMTMSA